MTVNVTRLGRDSASWLDALRRHQSTDRQGQVQFLPQRHKDGGRAFVWLAKGQVAAAQWQNSQEGSSGDYEGHRGLLHLAQHVHNA